MSASTDPLVVDASVMVEILARTHPGQRFLKVVERAESVHVPEHFHIEVIAAIRGLRRRGAYDDVGAVQALAALRLLRVRVHPVMPMLDRVWALRDVLTAYDAAYLALARSLDVGLLTADRGLAAAARSEGRLIDAP